ncbi:pilus assembly protein PilW [Stutzerimonas stutzeri]|uniref:Pilus assembly protein PilW n=1 Tax=Stutzerimonas stutzeri TaxID=316 RepID=A0A2S4AQV3_STUST|nr:PilW family protein [Stutzerimonas stutzeri]MCQ4262305.1 PilW family protein [Stutzerimonas stutzeri]POH83851.1 pilus assembly protein PilW [Stutzerimonas stutzeri]
MKTAPCNRQMGLSLIELMVAMLISLILLGGVLQVFLSSKDMYRTNTAVARVQEAGRFATEFIAFDVRQAGYKGECLSDPFNQLDLSSATTDQKNAYSTTPAIQGWDNSKPVFFTASDPVRADTDSFIVKYAGDGIEFETDGSNSANPTDLKVKGETGAYDGQIVLVANSTGCDIFQNTNNGTESKLTTSNASGMSQTYNGKFTAHILRSHTYFIRNNDGRLPSLWRRVLSPTPATEELVEGIIDMQVTYGIDKNGDRLADEYVKAGEDNLTSSGVGDWNKVVSARISVLAVSPEINVLDEPQTFIFPAIAGIDRDDEYALYKDDGTVIIKNNRVAQVYTATVAIRNRLP